MGTPKQKAEYLVKRFTAHVHGENGEQNWINATLCALIDADTLLEEIGSLPLTKHTEQKMDYWQEVKNELQKM